MLENSLFVIIALAGVAILVRQLIVAQVKKTIREHKGAEWLDHIRSLIDNADTIDELLDIKTEMKRNGRKQCWGQTDNVLGLLNLMRKLERKLDNLVKTW